MSSYVLPQVQVFQLFRQLPQNVVKNLNAFVFGEHYQLFRYDEPAEKELVSLGAYDPDTDTSYAWPSLPAGGVVDQDYTKVYADNLWAQYFSVPESSDHEAQIVSAAERNKVRVDSTVFQTANGVTRSASVPRDVRIGDRVRYEYVEYTGSIFSGTSKVVGLEADLSDAVVGDGAVKASNQDTLVGTADLDTGNAAAFAAATGNSSPMTDSIVLGMEAEDTTHRMLGWMSKGLLGDDITITVTTGGAAGVARARVSYGSGLYLQTNVPIAAVGTDEGQLYIGHGLYINFIAGGGEDTEFAVGDVYTATVQAPLTTVAAPLTQGTYTGTTDTTYRVEVVRGGKFNDRSLTVLSSTDTDDFAPGITASAGTGFANWLGGEMDAEYALLCTATGATLADCVFSLTSTVGDNSSGLTFPAANTAYALGTLGVTLTTPANAAHVPLLGQIVVIRVNASRPRVKITDTRGIDATQYLTVADADTYYSLGSLGAELSFAANLNNEGSASGDGGLLLGDVFYVECTAAAPGAVKTLVLADTLHAGIAPLTDIALWLYSVQNSKAVTAQRLQSPPDWNWVGDSAGLVVNSGLEVQDPSIVGMDGTQTWLPVYKADMYVEYRALLVNYADTIRAIEAVSDVEPILGAIHPDNPLAQGVYNALLNSGDRAVYFMAVQNASSSGWMQVLDRAALSSDVYAFAPLTQDLDILAAVQEHINAASTETEKHWRVAFVGTELPAEVALFGSAVSLTGTASYATLTEDSVTDANTLLSAVTSGGDPDPDAAFITTVKPGDKVRIAFETDAWGAPTYEEFTVAVVLSNNTLRVASGPATEIDVPTTVEIWHPYSTQETADAVAARSTGFYSRRMYHVFPSQAVGNRVVQSSPFVAAAVAGLASSVPPQQPLTNIQLVGFEDLPIVYKMFSRAQLNKMAEYGTMIVMQENAGGRVYIRHQLSTAASGGDLNKSELSITKNVDSVSYYFAERFAPYIGQYNITPELLNTLENILLDGLAYLSSLTDVGLLGPQLIAEETELVGLNQHPTLRDHVEAVVNLGVPKPFNVLQLRLIV